MLTRKSAPRHRAPAEPPRYGRVSRRTAAVGAFLLSVSAFVGGCVIMTAGAMQGATALAERYRSTQASAVAATTVNAGLTYRVRSVAATPALTGRLAGLALRHSGSLFVVVRVTVTNPEKVTRTFLSRYVQLRTRSDRPYDVLLVDPSSSADPGSASVALDPGRSADRTLVFQVPAGDVAGCAVAVEDVRGRVRVKLPLGL